MNGVLSVFHLSTEHRGGRIGACRTIVTSLLVAGLSTFGAPAWAQGERGQASSDIRHERAAVDTIYVTARKREERLIDTPVAATALPKAALERYNITQFSMLTTAIPGINIYQASGGDAGGNLEIRGVGKQALDYGAEQPVALVVDGFSFTRGHAINMAFFDVESVEVLKGPQTLFFGKNSPAGVISVKTVTPGDVFEGFARASYEFRTEDPVLEFGVSVPVNEKLAIRVAGRGQFMQGGYLKNSTTTDVVRDLSPYETDALYPWGGAAYSKYPKQKQYVGRITAMFTPTDNFDATLKFAASRTRQNDAGPMGLYACADGPGTNPYFDNAFFDDPSTPGIAENLIPDSGQTCPDRLGTVNLERPGSLPPAEIGAANSFGEGGDELYYRTRNILTTLEMNWAIGDITLTSISGYWDYSHEEFSSYDWTSYAGVGIAPQGEGGHSFSTEFRVQSDYDSPVNFMLGVFYEDTFRDVSAPGQIFPLGPAPAGPYPSRYEGTFLTYDHAWNNWIDSVSVFGEVIWEITQDLELSGGVRYTDETRKTEGVQLFNRLDEFYPALGLPAGASPFAPSGSMVNLRRDFSDVSPSATLSWHPVDDVLIFAAYKTGFQAAGISNPGTFGNFFSCLSGCPLSEEDLNEALTFDGTDVEGFELGVKGQFFDGRLRAELIGWRYRYDGLQVAIFNSDTTTFTIQNAAAAVNKGIEGSLTFVATDDLELRGSFQYVHQKYKDYTDAQCYAGQDNPAASNYVPELAALCAFDAGVGDLVQDMSGERYGGGPLQFQLGFTWDYPIANGDWFISFSGDVIYKQKGKPFLRQPNTALPSYVVLDLSARLYQGDGGWGFAVICSNCSNEKYVTYITDKPLGSTGDLRATIGMPRLVTLQATYRW